MKAWKRIFVVAALVLSVFTLPAMAVTITIVPVHGNDGTGFYDATARAAVGGNPETTLGKQRLFAARYVASLLGSRIQSSVEIRVSATFKPLTCTQNSGLLGHAGSNGARANFPNAPKADVYYPLALANAIAGGDMDLTVADIGAEFNSTLDAGDSSCLQGKTWYYGIDGNPPTGSLDFTSTFAHELLHGLGFSSLTHLQTGALADVGEPDIFTTYIRDLDQNKDWPDLTDAERVASAINTNRLVWDGASVTANGVPSLTAGTAGGKVKLYAPDPLDPGSSVSHWDESLAPNALMEAYADDDVAINNGLGLATCLLQDIGWTLTAGTQCPDVHVAQAADLFATPSTLDFGTVTLGGTASSALTLSNTGDKPLVINSVVAPASPYAITSNSCNGLTLFTGMQCQVEVSFTPTLTGTLTDTLGISSNGGNTSIALTAVAQPVPAPLIEATPTSLSFGDIELGHPGSKTLSVKNNGNADLIVGSLTGLVAPFTLSADACSGATLAPTASCNLTVSFAPTALAAANGQLTIPSNDQDVTINVDGTGVDLLKPDITIDLTSLVFAEAAVGSTHSLNLTVTNNGGDTLRITSVAGLSAPFSAPFLITADSCNGQDIEVTQNCQITVAYQPTSTGNSTATLTIDSNDPDTAAMNVAISGSATDDIDHDGVTNSEENAGPNGGDANQDGTLDVLQPNVATLTSVQGDYVTLVTSQGAFAGVQSLAAPAGLQLPANMLFPHGFLAFKVTGIATGGSAEVTLTLPTGAAPDHYYKFANGDSVTMDVSDQVTFNGNSLTLTLTDGARGDTDLTADGVITDPGGSAVPKPPAPATPKPPASSGGSGGGAIPPWSLLALLLLGLGRSKSCHR